MAQFRKSLALAGRRDAVLVGEFADLFASLKNLFARYHPERHYMRGPGPAWHIKHGGSQLNGTRHRQT
jgi:hypothetical protein